MTLLRRKGFLAAVAMTALLGLYAAYVGQRAFAFMATGEPVGVAMGIGLLVMPIIGLWWLALEWRLSAAVQRMGDELVATGRLPVPDEARGADGRVGRRAMGSEELEAAFETARLEAQARPDDWDAWFQVGFAYDASGDRRMARRSLAHAASLWRAARRV